MSSTLKLGILGSGKGSNFRAIADAIAAGTLDAEVRVVASESSSAETRTTAFCGPNTFESIVSTLFEK